MHRVSSNLTLVLRIFLPIFWAIFFGAFLVALLFVHYEGPGYLHTWQFRLGAVLFYTGGLVIQFFTFLRLRRVEVSDDFLYVTNYLRTARYPFHNVAEIRTTRLPVLNLGSVVLNQPGIFGRKIYFLHSSEAFERVILVHPELSARFRSREA